MGAKETDALGWKEDRTGRDQALPSACGGRKMPGAVAWLKGGARLWCAQGLEFNSQHHQKRKTKHGELEVLFD